MEIEIKDREGKVLFTHWALSVINRVEWHKSYGDAAPRQVWHD